MAAPMGHAKYKGAGRPKGSANTPRAEFIQLIHKIGKPSELVEKMKELTMGVLCSKTSPDGDVVIYSQPPSQPAIAYLLDQAYGKAKQSVEIEAVVRTIEDELDELPE